MKCIFIKCDTCGSFFDREGATFVLEDGGFVNMCDKCLTLMGGSPEEKKKILDKVDKVVRKRCKKK